MVTFDLLRRNRTSIRRLFAVAAFVAGVALLAGCLPVPANKISISLGEAIALSKSQDILKVGSIPELRK